MREVTARACRRPAPAKKHVPTTGLYYPFIHFKDDGWLKLTALYWDKMARIVPSSYRRVGDSRVVLERDSYVTRELAEIDFIRNLSPSEVTYPVSSLWQQLLSRHACGVRKPGSHAATAYSWISPPRRSRRSTRSDPAEFTSTSGGHSWSGGARLSARCGRWPL